ncbi:MAG: hypothetical protein R2711_14530 [Acidimicrobiales bacterium]
MLESLTPVLRRRSSTPRRPRSSAASSSRATSSCGSRWRRCSPRGRRRAEGDVLLHGLVVALSWTTWDLLRAAQEQSVAQARAVVTLMVRSLLGTVADPW